MLNASFRPSETCTGDFCVASDFLRAWIPPFSPRSGTNTVSSLCAARQMFRLEVLHREGSAGLRGCYLSQFYFSLQLSPPDSRVVYFNPWKLERLLPVHSPLAGWSQGWQLHKSPLLGANRWYKIRQRPPMLWGRSGSIKSYLPCTTVQPPHLPHSVPVHRALSNTGKTHQASAAQWFISYFDEAAGFSPPSPPPLPYPTSYCGTFGSFRKKPINISRPVTLTAAGVTKSCFMFLLLGGRKDAAACLDVQSGGSSIHSKKNCEGSRSGMGALLL